MQAQKSTGTPKIIRKIRFEIVTAPGAEPKV